MSEIFIDGIKLFDPFIGGMAYTNGSTFIAILTTVGRITGKPHTRRLKAVKYDNKIYFSRHKPDSDWFKNIIKTPAVKVQIGRQTFSGSAGIVHDEILSKTISELKYPGEARAHERRVVAEVSLCELS